MKLICSAKYRPLDSNYFMIATGKRHSDVFEWMFKHQIQYDKTSSAQGFLTYTNQFVDRYEAKQIAIKANQLIVTETEVCAELFYRCLVISNILVYANIRNVI